MYEDKICAHYYGNKQLGFHLLITKGPQPIGDKTLYNIDVKDKRHAKQVCKQHGWLAWNF